MTVEQFQQVHVVSEFDLPEWDKAIQMVMVMTGKTESQVEAMSVRKFNRMCRKINNAFRFEEKKIPKTIRIGAKFYKVNLMVSDMKARKYVEGVEFGKQTIPNLHKIMATVVEPCTWYGKPLGYDAAKHEQYATDMLKMDFNVAFSTAVFFCKLFAASMKASRPYLTQELMSKGVTEIQAVKDLTDLQSVLDGLARANRLQNTKGLN